MGNIAGVKNKLQRKLSSFRDMVQRAFEHNNTMLRGEVDKIKETIAIDVKTQLKEYSDELTNILKENTKVIDNKIIEKNDMLKAQMDLLETNINESLQNIKDNGMSMGGGRGSESYNDGNPPTSPERRACESTGYDSAEHPCKNSPTRQ